MSVWYVNDALNHFLYSSHLALQKQFQGCHLCWKKSSLRCQGRSSIEFGKAGYFLPGSADLHQFVWFICDDVEAFAAVLTLQNVRLISLQGHKLLKTLCWLQWGCESSGAENTNAARCVKGTGWVQAWEGKPGEVMASSLRKRVLLERTQQQDMPSKMETWTYIRAPRTWLVHHRGFPGCQHFEPRSSTPFGRMNLQRVKALQMNELQKHWSNATFL